MPENKIMKLLALSVLSVGLFAVPAHATVVQYYTTGYFSNCTGQFSCSGPAQTTLSDTTSNGLSVTFNADGAPLSPDNYSVPPVSYAQFGYFDASGPTNTDTGSAVFTLTVNQVMPTPVGTETLSSNTITGTITGNSSGLVVNFTPSGTTGSGAASQTLDPYDLVLNPPQSVQAVTFTITTPFGGFVTYYVDESTPINPANGGEFSNINGAVNASTSGFQNPNTPEPGLYAITLSGLFCLFIATVRRNRRKPVKLS